MAAKHDVDIDELLDGSMMDRARIRARSRLIDSVDSKDGVEVASIGDIHTEEGRLLEAFSFYYARLVVGASEDERLISRWAQAEAERAQRILERDSAIRIIANTYLSEIECDEKGIWKDNDVEIIGVDIDAINICEDREQFKQLLKTIEIPVAPAKTATSFLKGKEGSSKKG